MKENAGPNLEGEALDAVEYRGGHLQIIASAGSGKTEVVSQRVAGLLAEGVAGNGIVAFTFTERAAAELKGRIERRAAELMGEDALNRLNGMFVGTIHAYCFRLLQQYVPRYETYDVLDDHRLTAFLTRYDKVVGIRPDLHSKMFEGIKLFGLNVQVVENELIDAEKLKDPFRSVYEKYLNTLDEHHFLTYGQQIARAIEALEDPRVFGSVHGPLRHLIVDEYQDVNPAQERLIQALSKDPVQVCVVGDDDQSIYQWRGSDVANIVSFANRYERVRSFEITINRRSRPAIIDTANFFAGSIQGRLQKSMEKHRSSSRSAALVSWHTETEEEQAHLIANSIRRFHDELGYAYRAMAVLCRGRVSFEPLLTALEDAHIPVQPGGRTMLFSTPEADLFGRTMCWLAGHKWRAGLFGWGREEPVDLGGLLGRYRSLYDLDDGRIRRVRARLLAWKQTVHDSSAPANLIRDFYELLSDVGADEFNLADPWEVSRLGTLARCSQVLVDYEATKRRPRPDPDRLGKMKGGQDRGKWYYKMLAIYIVNWARGAYEGFEGEENVNLDAVDLTTIHQAKGLEWPIVFVPSLTSKRFPSSRTGEQRNWLVPKASFSAARYEGSVNDERRLFYVAMTRARDYLSLSCFDRIRQPQQPSPFLAAVARDLPLVDRLPDPAPPEKASAEDNVVDASFSDLALYLECGFAYRLRRLLGFQPPLVPELGFGKAVHHVMRVIAEFVQDNQRVPKEEEIARIIGDEFYLPAASRAGHQEMGRQAAELVATYVENHEEDLRKVWAVERPFELHLGEATIAGRADVVIDRSIDGVERLEIIDYKTATEQLESFDFQLQVYTDAGQREGLVVDGAYIHDMKTGDRTPVDVSEDALLRAERKVRDLIIGLERRQFGPNPGERCGRCDVRLLCKARMT